MDYLIKKEEETGKLLFAKYLWLIHGRGLPENVGPNTLCRARTVRVFPLTLALTLTLIKTCSRTELVYQVGFTTLF